MKHIVTTPHFTEKSHCDIVNRVVGKYIVVRHGHMAVPHRGLRRKLMFDVDIDILCPTIGKYSIDIFALVTQDCASEVLLSQEGI